MCLCLVLILVLFCLPIFFVQEAAAQAKTFKFGLISSMTGPMAAAFKNIIDAAKPAEDLMNKWGGLLSKVKDTSSRLSPKTINHHSLAQSLLSTE